MLNETIDIIKQYLSDLLSTELIPIQPTELKDEISYSLCINGNTILLSVTGTFVSLVECAPEIEAYLDGLNIQSFIIDNPGCDLSLSDLVI